MAIQVLQHPLAQGISSAGSALGSALRARGEREFESEEKEKEFTRKRDLEEAQRMRQQQTSGSIQQAISQLGENPSAMDYVGVLNEVLGQGGDPDTVKQYGSLLSTLQKTSNPLGAFEGKSESELGELFQKFGMDEATSQRFASLYPTLSVGGRTQFANYLFDNIQRGQPGAGLFGGAGIPQGAPQMPGSEVEPTEPQANVEGAPQGEFRFPQIEAFKNLTAKEKVGRQTQNSKDNLPIYNESVKNIKAQKIAGRTIRRLTQLNDSDKLPTGLGKALNINYKTGDIRIPAGANPETQLFAKTVNEFLKGAKEIFGARVTNFELDRFMQGLPTLANTKEGRMLILKQMGIVNRMSQLEGDSLKEVYNHYGLKGGDVQEAQQVADQLMAPQEAALNKEYDNVLFEVEIQEVKGATPPGQVAVEIGGQMGYVPESQLQDIINRKGRRL